MIPAPLVFKPILELQWLARIGLLPLLEPLYDPVSQQWHYAVDYAVLRPFFRHDSGARDEQWQQIRPFIFARDQYRCAYCRTQYRESLLEVDHRLPRSRGGTEHPGNLTTACGPCNSQKNDMTDVEYATWRSNRLVQTLCLSRLLPGGAL